MKQWDCTIKIKDLFERDAKDHDEVARRIGPIAAGRVRDLAEMVESKDLDLSMDLEDIADWFADCPNEDRPQYEFNEALKALYNLGDSYRVWIS